MSITNDERAAWAVHGLLAYATGKEGGDDLYDEAELVISDFLADLMHYAAREGIAFQACIDRASANYEEECTEDAPAADFRVRTAELLDALESLASFYRRRESEGDHHELRMRKCEAWGKAKRAMANARSALSHLDMPTNRPGGGES